jgi:hypothetical protein
MTLKPEMRLNRRRLNTSRSGTTGSGDIHLWGIFPLLTIIMGNFNMLLKDLSSVVLQVQYAIVLLIKQSVVY